jgi:hypothetical protein
VGQRIADGSDAASDGLGGARLAGEAADKALPVG